MTNRVQVFVLALFLLLTAASTAAAATLTEDYSRASKIIGAPVYGPDGVHVASVDDLVLQDGKVTGAVLSVGGFLGLGVRLVVVPFEQITVNGRHFNVPSDKHQLLALPEFRYKVE